MANKKINRFIYEIVEIDNIDSYNNVHFKIKLNENQTQHIVMTPKMMNYLKLPRTPKPKDYVMCVPTFPTNKKYGVMYRVIDYALREEPNVWLRK